MNPIIRYFRTINQLGFKSSFLYAVYQTGLKSGYYRRITPNSFYVSLPNIDVEKVRWMTNLPTPGQLRSVMAGKENELESEAEEILHHQLRFFGNKAIPFKFEQKNNPFAHWTEAEAALEKSDATDIKTTWEPARFNWVFPLERAYLLFGSEVYAQQFWHLFDEFTEANLFNSGLNWCSAQEVALRMMALIFGGSVFRNSKSASPEKLSMLLASIYLHAKRIPPTLVYARAQNNNHLLTEAVGLYCAGSFFRDLPFGDKWQKLGSKYFNQAIQDQISEKGEYIQHSLNYHRLMLKISLWMNLFVKQNDETLPSHSLNKLGLATEWLLDYIEPTNGHVPNLGHNDGSNIFPLSQCDYADYRPVAQAASVAFLGKPALQRGYWNEELLWLGLKTNQEMDAFTKTHQFNKVPWIGSTSFRIYVRAAKYNRRPAHADQLHADIWYRGINIAKDAGTFSYNLAPPWQNALAQTAVHNTIAIDGMDQMTPAGKFLWLDWTNANITELDNKTNVLEAEHDGYWRFGIIHRRRITLDDSKNTIDCEDFLETRHLPTIEHTARLHWLLPDWEWTLNSTSLNLKAPFGKVTVSISDDSGEKPVVDLIREGKSLLYKRNTNPNLGCYSATYLQKEPALSFCYSIVFDNPLKIKTEWKIIDGK